MNARRKEWKNLKVMENMKITRKKELNKEDFKEKKAKDLMTVAQKEQHQVNWKLEQRLHRH